MTPAPKAVTVAPAPKPVAITLAPKPATPPAVVAPAAGERLGQCGALGVHVLPASHHTAQEVGVQWVRGWRPDVLHLHSFWLWPVAVFK